MSIVQRTRDASEPTADRTGHGQQIQMVCSDYKGQGRRINPQGRHTTCSGNKVVREKILEIHIDKGKIIKHGDSNVLAKRKSQPTQIQRISYLYNFQLYSQRKTGFPSSSCLSWKLWADVMITEDIDPMVHLVSKGAASSSARRSLQRGDKEGPRTAVQCQTS